MKGGVLQRGRHGGRRPGRRLVPAPRGTVGGHYRSAGYPHLHLLAFFGPRGEYERFGVYGSRIKGRDARIADPLMLYVMNLEEPALVAALSEDRKRVRIPVVSGDGAIYPPASKVVWPVRCRRKGKV